MRTFLLKTLVSAGILGVLTGFTLPDTARGATYNLKATTGTVTMPDGAVIPIWGYADCGTDPIPNFTTCGPAILPGPQLEVPAGDTTLTINLKNDLPEPVSLLIPGQKITPAPAVQAVPGQSVTTAVADSVGYGVYTFTAPKPGTYLYESGTNQAKQVQMGLYGALIVRPSTYSATNKIAYITAPPALPAPTYDWEKVVLLSEIDPEWHTAVWNGGLNNGHYNAYYFSPKYWLINGKAYPDTREILDNLGGTVLLRYLNAGSQDHVMVIQGVGQKEQANNGFPVTYPQETFAVVMNPGQTQDLTIQPMAENVYPLYDRRLDVTNKDQFPGGMITMVRVIDLSRLANPTGLNILSTAPTLVTEGKIYSYDMVAVDGSNLDATLSYSLTSVLGTSLPMVMNPSTGKLTWQTTHDDVSALKGSWAVTAMVSTTTTLPPPPGTSLSQTFSIYVNSNPVVSPVANFSVSAGMLYSTPVSATDADNDTMTYSLQSAPLGMTLVTTVNGKYINWTPTESQVGTYMGIQLVVSDGRGGIGSSAFQGTVTSSQNKLALTPGPQFIAANAVSAQVTIQALDPTGAFLTTSSANVTLSSDYGTMEFSTSSLFTTTTSTITLASGQGTFYFRDSGVGNPTLTAASTGFASATQKESIGTKYLVTISAAEYGTTTTMISSFKFIVNLDNATVADPFTKTCPDVVEQLNPPRSTLSDPVTSASCTSFHQYESNSPVVATGTVTSGLASVNLPPGRYLVSIVAGDYDPTTDPRTFDLQMRNGGLYKQDGIHFTVNSDGTYQDQNGNSPVKVELHKDPLILSQVTVKVFHDNRPINAGWDANTETVPTRNGVIDHFKIEIFDSIGPTTTDYFGNPLCTEYGYVLDASGNPVIDPATGLKIPDPTNITKMGGVCLTDDTGFISIKNLHPDRYNVFAIPPVGSDWVQTTTIEGTKGTDAWAVEAGNGLLPEMIGPQGWMVFQGFIRPCTFGNLTDDCPTNNVAGTGTITGHVVRLQPARPPYNQPDGLGADVDRPWVALNNLSGSNEQVALVQGDAHGNFTITGVPEGRYQVVIWDDPQDFIISFYNLTMPEITATGGTNYNVVLRDPRFATSGIPIPDWYGGLYGDVYYDLNEDGVRDPATEPGLAGEYVEVRFRDGSLTYSTVTDGQGHYKFREYFPWMHFNVAGIGYSRLGSTGIHVVAGEGLTVLGQPVVEDRTDLGPVLVMGTLSWAGDWNRIDWGKKPYPLSGYTNPVTLKSTPPLTLRNGGFSGIVWYATTRNEGDIRYAVTAPWEPGIPDLYLNLYERVIDPATGKTIMDPVTGAAVKGKRIGRVITDHYNRPSQIPTNCPSVAPYADGIDPDTGLPVNVKCYEVLSTWQQVRPAAYDGAYQFFYDQSDPNNPNELLDCDVVGVGTAPGQCRSIAPGTYLIEVEVPENYLPLTENDRNVILQGDPFIINPLKEVPKCVGPTYQVFDATTIPFNPGFGQTDAAGNPIYGSLQSPNLGKMVNTCTMKEVTLDAYSNGATDFRLFTEVPIPARLVGFVNDNINLQGVSANGWFGDKPGVPFVPVSVRDFAGREVARTYTDPNGMFEVLLPSTNRVNVPKPTGLAPNMVLVYANDPGTPSKRDSAFNTKYDTLVMQFELIPGRVTIPDMALTPVNGFLANQTIDCSPSADTPQITGVSQPFGDNSGASTFEIQGTGFGLTTASSLTAKATLDGVPLVINSWTAGTAGTTDLISVNIPATVPAGRHQLSVTAENGKVSPTGMTIHVTGTGYNPGFVTTVNPNSSTATIQAAIDAAPNGSVILVPKGIYAENPILWKSVTLQGYGPANTIVDGSYISIAATLGPQTAWTNKMNALIANGSITVQGGQPVANLFSTLTVVAKQGRAGRAFIDGMTLQGARVGGGVFVNSYANNTVISNNVIQNNIGNFSGGVSLGFPLPLGTNVLSGVRVHHNQIVYNGSGVLGSAGGISTFQGVTDYRIDHNLICANGAVGKGGGVYHSGVSTGLAADRIDHNDILFNWAFNNGGGILLEGVPNANLLLPSPGTGPVNIEENRIQGNFSVLDGGGINITSAGTYPVMVFNNMIVNNITSQLGGAVSVHDASAVKMINNTIASNNSTSTSLPLDPGPHTGGLAIFENTVLFQNSLPIGSPLFSDVVLLNNIFWANTAYTWSALQTFDPARVSDDVEIFPAVAGTLSNVRGNLFSNMPAMVDTPSKAFNIAGQDPLFVTTYANVLTGTVVVAAGEVAINPIAVPVTLTYSPLASTAGDYHVTDISPALDYGSFNIAGAAAAPGVDIDGEVRPIDNCIDAGADERAFNKIAPPANVCIPPTASALPVTGNEGTAVTVDASASTQQTGPSAIVSYAWNFGDGTTAMSTTSTINHTYRDNLSGIAGICDPNVNPCAYNVSFVVTSTQGLTAGATTTATIFNVAPTAYAGPDAIVNSGAAYTFHGTATDPSPVDSTSLKYVLNWGDGNSTSGTVPASGLITQNHQFPVYSTSSTNQYTVTLTVTDKDLASGVSTLVVTINDVPIITSTPVTNAVVNYLYTYQVVATDRNNPVLAYSLTAAAWMTINPATGLITGTPAITDLGSSPVTVTVTDNMGGTATQTYTINVFDDAIFSDSFESGNTGAWTPVVGSANQTVEPSRSVTLGAQGLRIQVKGNAQSYLVDQTPSAENSYHARFYFDPNTVNLASSTQNLLTGVQGTVDVFRIQFRVQSGSYGIVGQMINNGATYYTTSFIPMTDDIHSLEVAWEASTMPTGTGNGSLILYRDGVQVGSLTSIQNSNRRVEEVRIGIVNPNLSTSAAGFEYLDDFVSTRKSVIGPKLLQERWDGAYTNLNVVPGQSARWFETDTTNFLNQAGLLVWSTGSTTASKIATLASIFKLDNDGLGEFDTRVDYNLISTLWPAPGTGRTQSVGFVVSGVTTTGAIDTTNQLTVTRKRTPVINGYESVATVGGVSSAQVASSTATAVFNGQLRFTRSGDMVTAWYWNGTTGPWIALNSATLPAGPLFITLVGQETGGTTGLVMGLDTLKISKGSIVP